MQFEKNAETIIVLTDFRVKVNKDLLKIQINFSTEQKVETSRLQSLERNLAHVVYVEKL